MEPVPQISLLVVFPTTHVSSHHVSPLVENPAVWLNLSVHLLSIQSVLQPSVKLLEVNQNVLPNHQPVSPVPDADLPDVMPPKEVATLYHKMVSVNNLPLVSLEPVTLLMELVPTRT